MEHKVADMFLEISSLNEALEYKLRETIVHWLLEIDT